jgi:hypothetical protein
MKLGRRAVTFGIGAAIFGAAEARGGDGNPVGQMILASEDSSVRLRVVGYQFPDIIDDEWDSNWLIIDGSVSLAGREWRFRNPCLTTLEAKHLADWLDACAHGTAEVPYCGFTEPLLQFDLVDPQTLRISFALEAAPPWARRGDAWTKHGFNLRVGPMLTQAATELRNQLRQFPVRGPDRA